jgi:predicted GIY-YIG superfamily endonuclease
MKKISWDDLHKNSYDLIENPGIYAWYYKPIISLEDINNIKLQLSSETIKEKKIDLVKDFLQKYLLDFYKEDPYNAVISGNLKPQYKGNIFHEDQVSHSFAEKVVDETIDLFKLKEILMSIDESFLSPIYIGVSENLKTRLLQHKSMIKKQADSSSLSDTLLEKLELIDDRDQCFANRIIKRKYILSSLFVVLKTTDSYNPIENILNRINYPILGRN